MNKVFIFPGQGSQVVGMGKDLYQNFAVAKQVFDEVDDALSEKLSEIIFNGPEEELTKTQNTQPALMAVSIAIVKTLEHLLTRDISQLCSLTAGHSLGQYSAICASGGLSVSDSARLLRARGLFMQSACQEGEGSMAAILGVDHATIEEVLEKANQIGICDIANDNSKDQIVISGLNAAIDHAINLFKEKNIKAIKLKVSAPFHSRLMQPACDKMREAIENTNFNDLAVPVLDNTTLAITAESMFLKQTLLNQIVGTVRWRETMDIIADRYSEAIEIGSGKVLTNLFKKSYPEFKVTTINTIANIEDFVSSL